MITHTPVLFLIFNRPDLTRQVFARIREAHPSQLFIGADGPRPDRPGEAALCVEARSIVDEVDWPCQVHTFFRDENLGCKRAVSGAITWYFEHVEEGIILEDDCLPHPTFFRFCAELLERYRADERVMVISGNNFQPEDWRSSHSYYFSSYNHIWGWASWRRAWAHYDGDVSAWPSLRKSSLLETLHPDQSAVHYWTGIFDRVHAGQIDSWDYPWTFSCWARGGLTVLPAVNLVSNLGFDERATHTKNGNLAAANMPARPMGFPLRHPPEVVVDKTADCYTTRHLFGVHPLPPVWRRAARKMLSRIRSLT